jgi:hypothetical protein
MVGLMEQNTNSSSCLKISPHLYNFMFELQIGAQGVKEGQQWF